MYEVKVVELVYGLFSNTIILFFPYCSLTNTMLVHCFVPFKREVLSVFAVVGGFHKPFATDQTFYISLVHLIKFGTTFRTDLNIGNLIV